MVRIGRAVRKRRLELGIQQQGMADALGMSVSAYGAIERGERNFALSTLHRVCAVLRVEPWELLREAETSPDPPRSKLN